MTKRPTPRAMRKVLDETTVRETSPGEADPSVAPVEKIRRGRPDPLPKDVVSKLGRPGVYCDNYPELARRLSLVGLTDEEMASVFGIAVATLYRWDETHPLFREVRARGRVMADADVAAKLYHRATGYEHEAVKIFMPQGATEPVYAPYTEYFPPDTQAATWWLKNRQKEKWKDRTTLAGDPENPLVVEQAAETRAQLIARLEAMAKPEPLTIDHEEKDP